MISGRRIHPHLVFELLAYFFALIAYLYLRRAFGDPIPSRLRWAVVAAAIGGAALGSKLLYWMENPRLTLANVHDLSYLLGGKTIVGALAFGLVGVELTKRYIGIEQSTGDLYAIPLALGIAVGRVGCFLTGLSDNTYGTATSLPWGIDFGDGILRHPTQIYEIIFLLAMMPILFRVLGTLSSPRPTLPFEPGDAFKIFMVSYSMFRLLCDFIKPYPHIALGLGGIQWACVLVLLYYSRDIKRWVGGERRPAPRFVGE